MNKSLCIGLIGIFHVLMWAGAVITDQSEIMRASFLVIANIWIVGGWIEA